jgi:spermidine/putrescine transport system ATP-binding protein
MSSPSSASQNQQGSVMVQLSSIRKSFDELEVVKGVDLQIGAGEFFSLLGPSGCGKTTLLRMIAGFEAPNEGHITIDGQAMDDVDANERPTNMVFQSYAIFPHLSVGENVAYGLKKQRLAKNVERQRVDEMLKMVDLEGLYSRPSYALSGGQRQRVALARALIMEPKVLLLDEPLSALDKKLREHMQQELRRLQRTLGITFILVTHDQEEALIMSDRIAVMFDGNIEQLGRPQEIYERPVSKRVASFIGVMNFIEGEYIGRKGKQLKVRADALGEVLLEQEQMPTEIEPGRVTIGLRPEMMTVLYHKSDKSEKEFNATVENVDYYGDMTYYTVTLPKSDDQVTISMRNTAGRHVYEIGDKVRIGWGSASMVILV